MICNVCIFALIILIKSEDNSSEYVLSDDLMETPDVFDFDSDLNDVEINGNVKNDGIDNKFKQREENAKQNYNKCLTTRSKCRSDKECCSQECNKPLEGLMGYCGRDE